MTRISTEIRENVAHVTLTREDKMNGMDSEMIDAIIETGDALCANEDIRAVVLSGEGRAFCAGLDVLSFATLASQDPQELLMPRLDGKNTNHFQDVAMVWRRVPVPVIASLHGVVFGAGLQMSLGADIRIAHPDTLFSVMEMKWGMIPDMGGMVLLPKLVRPDVMRQMIYTGEQVDATRASEWGLITQLSEDPLTAAQSLARDLANNSPSAIRAAKRLALFAESGASENEILLEECREQAGLIGRPHQMEAVAANMERRPPKY